MLQWHWSDGCGEADWLSDRGLAYGEGVFETLRVASSGPVLAAAHRERLLAGCRFLGLPFGADDWDRWWLELAERGWLGTSEPAGHVIKLIVTGGSGGRGYGPPSESTPRVVCSRSAMPPVPATPVVLRLCRQRVHPDPSGMGLKTITRLEQVIAAAELPAGFFEGLMTDSRGRPVEGTRTNLFVFRDNTLYTPPLWQLAVAGVMRRAIIDNAPRWGIKVVERPVSLSFMAESEGVFITNSLMGILPVARIDCLNLPQAEGISVIRQGIQQQFGV